MQILENPLIVASIMLCYSLYVLFLSKRQVHMLQLNSYINARYLRWFMGPQSVEWMPFAQFFIKRHPQKKKLVITDRVKRLFGSIVLLLVILGFAVTSLFTAGLSDPVKILLLLALFLMAELKLFFVLLANTLNLPIEKSIADWYVRDAKKKLRSHSRLLRIGITGSYGKTSTKYILSRMLSEKFNVLMTPESYNTTLGVVRTIREQLKPSHEVFVVEMGAKKIGDIAEICALVKPKHGILTAIGPQHLETFHSVQNIIDTKFALIDSLPEEGMAFLNYENAYIPNRKHKKQTMSYGIENPSLKYWAENIVYDHQGIRFDLCSYKNLRQPLNTKLLGLHNVLNIVGAGALALEMGVEPKKIAVAVKQLMPIPHRLELKQHSENVLVIDNAYNSNPEGAAESLQVLGKFEKYYKILVTPGMVELGEREYAANFEFAKKAAGIADYIILVGENRAKPMAAGLKEAGYDAAKSYIAKNLKDGLEKLKAVTVPNTVILFENDLPDNYEG